jgi:hypothetical protein
VADYVLSSFRAEERETLPKTIASAAKSVIDIAARGVDAAMKRSNTRPKKKKPPTPKPGADTASSPEAGTDNTS